MVQKGSSRAKSQRAPSVHTLLVEAFYRKQPAGSFLFPEPRAFTYTCANWKGRTATKMSRLRPMTPAELRSLCTANGVPYRTSGSKGTGDPITSAHNNLHTLVNGRRHVNKKTGKGQDPSPSIARLLSAPLTPDEATELHVRAVAHHRATTRKPSGKPSRMASPPYVWRADVDWIKDGHLDSGGTVAQQLASTPQPGLPSAIDGGGQAPSSSSHGEEIYNSPGGIVDFDLLGSAGLLLSYSPTAAASSSTTTTLAANTVPGRRER